MSRTASIVLAAAGLLVILSGCSSSAASEAEATATAEPPTPPLEAAAQSCALGEPGVQVGDGGTSMTIDMEGSDDVIGSGPSVDQVACILGAVDVPDHVISRMDRTRALDGMQDADWGDYAASWTYHPDNGLDVILTHDTAG